MTENTETLPPQLGSEHCGSKDFSKLLPYCNRFGYPILSAIRRNICNQPFILPPVIDDDGLSTCEESLETEEQGIMVNTGSLLPQVVVEHIVYMASTILSGEPNVLKLKGPITVGMMVSAICGDLHGQLPDLLHVLDMCGNVKDPPINDEEYTIDKVPQYLFLGDYVDRGYYSCETVLYLLSLKVVHPTRIWMLRGNHETRAMTSKNYGIEGINFKQECIAKYDERLYCLIMNCFDQLPISAIVENPNVLDNKDTYNYHQSLNGVVSDENSQNKKWRRFLCMHGGLSPDIESLSDIESIDRKKEPPFKGAACDLLWADPLTDNLAVNLNAKDYKEFLELDFLPNPSRGCSVFFGYDAIRPFLKLNSLDGIIRAHQVVQDGVAFDYSTTRQLEFTYPLVTTVFTASNYCGSYLNMGAILNLNHTGISVKRFELTKRVNTWMKTNYQTILQPYLCYGGTDETETNRCAAFAQAMAKDAACEIHPGWSSLRNVIRAISVLKQSQSLPPSSSSYLSPTRACQPSIPVEQPTKALELAKAIVPGSLQDLRAIFDTID
eukprot:Ihof_evm6s89 gene=Ihof_evmTU6s89